MAFPTAPIADDKNGCARTIGPFGCIMHRQCTYTCTGRRERLRTPKPNCPVRSENTVRNHSQRLRTPKADSPKLECAISYL